jgi:hypothetical protein
MRRPYALAPHEQPQITAILCVTPLLLTREGAESAKSAQGCTRALRFVVRLGEGSRFAAAD